MSRHALTRCLLLCACLLLPARITAAPPVLTYLYPAGAPRATTVEVTAGGTFAHWPVNAWVEGQALTIKAGREKGRLTVTVPADAIPGTYWIRLVDDEGATAPRPFLVGALPEVLEQEPNDDVRKPQTLDTSAVTVNGRLQKPGDVDCFALRLRKGQTLVASVDANRVLGSPMDAVMQLLSADGFVLDENHDYHGLDPQLVFSVPRDGTYVVRLFAFPATPDASVRLAGAETFIYRLTLTTEGFADHAFPLAVTRSNPGAVELAGWNIPDAARTVKALPAKAAEEATVWHPRIANPVAVRVEPHATLAQAAANDLHHPQEIALPVTVSGCLKRRGEVHAYSFEGKQGQKLLFQVEAQALDFPVTAVLRLTDPSGKGLARAEAQELGRDPELAFTVPKDGTYHLEVRDLTGDGGPRHLYRLRALHAEPDFALTVAADQYVVTPGKPLDLAVKLERRHGFDGDVEITVDGLPGGVTAKVVSVSARANAVTVQLTATGPASSSPIRIVGKAKDREGLVRVAHAPIAGLRSTTSFLWLTLLPAPVR